MYNVTGKYKSEVWKFYTKVGICFIQQTAPTSFSDNLQTGNVTLMNLSIYLPFTLSIMESNKSGYGKVFWGKT